MITDSLEELPESLEAEVCIAGGGPAGIALALELAERGRSVILLEGGGLESPGDGADLYDGEVTGRSYPLPGSRLRWLGGTTNHWGGWVRPLDPVDFQARPHHPLPAWPFDHTELEPWYERADTWCEVSQGTYSPEQAGLEGDQRLLDLDPASGFETRLFRFSTPTRFGDQYRHRLRDSEEVDCRLNLNLVALEQNEDRVRSARAQTLEGDECSIRADFFVLAMGGLENPRLLLNQDRVPGNESDLVGRCFMDHFGFRPGRMLVPDSARYERFSFRGADLMPVIVPTAALLQARGLQNACMTLSETSDDDFLPGSWLDNPGLSRASGFARFDITAINEPVPHPESRVTLTDDTDTLGLRRLRLHWHLPESDFGSILSLAGHLARALGASGVGRLQRTETTATPKSEVPGVGYHHMGTTRMSAGPDTGVVDADCRVWDRENLYIAGSSVFPTAGYANPTLTIVALACRLARHLDRKLGGSGS